MTVFGTYQGASTIMREAFDWKRSRISILEIELVWSLKKFGEPPPRPTIYQDYVILVLNGRGGSVMCRFRQLHERSNASKLQIVCTLLECSSLLSKTLRSVQPRDMLHTRVMEQFLCLSPDWLICPIRC
jgi:hypothetical protein